MASNQASRIYTYVRTAAAATEAAAQQQPVTETLAQFSQCLVGAFASCREDNEARVNVELANGRLVLSQPTEDGPSYPFQHFARCPARELTESQRQDIPDSVSSRNVIGAVSILLESIDKRVLLTRRPRHMRTFPNVWVPPGGSIEPSDKHLLAAGVRELKEEVGIDLSEDVVTGYKPLCLWESVYPTSLEGGQPVRQHCVVYFHIKVDVRHRDLQVQMQPEEVGAYAWLDRDAITAAIGLPGCREDATFTVNELVGQGAIDEVEKSVFVLAKKYQSPDDMGAERLSSGTLFALARWNKSKSAPWLPPEIEWYTDELKFLHKHLSQVKSAVRTRKRGRKVPKRAKTWNQEYLEEVQRHYWSELKKAKKEAYKKYQASNPETYDDGELPLPVPV